jgi:N-hydroxyarylamine O-acetyltransferase
MAIIATINNTKYLVDVGFGEFSFLPLKIELNMLQIDQRGKFIIERHDDVYLIVKKVDVENLIPEYIFTETNRELSDFYEMCTYHQTNSNSHFTQKRLCSLPTENGRITISGNILKITENDEVTEINLNNEEEFNKALWDNFKIKL